MKRYFAVLFVLLLTASACGGDSSGDGQQSGAGSSGDAEAESTDEADESDGSQQDASSSGSDAEAESTDEADESDGADGSQQDASSESGEPDEPEASGDDSAASGPTAVIEEDTTIQFWIPGGRGRDEGAAAVVEAFAAVQPNVTVEVTAFPFNEFFDAVQVALAGSNPPDVVMLDGVAVQNVAFNGGLAPLTDLFAAEDIADFSPDLVATGTWEGELYGAPWQNSAIALYYNVDFFDAAGVDVPSTLEDAWTWPEFKENVEAVIAHQAESGNEIFGTIGLNTPIQGSYFAGALIRSNSSPGEGLWEGIAPDLSTVDGYINTPEAIEALEFYQSLYRDGFAPREGLPDAFGTGLVATYYAIPPSASGLNANFPDLNWDVMPIPFFKTPVTHTGSFAPVIPARSSNMDAARAFVHYLVSTDGQLVWNEISPGLPGRASAAAALPELSEGYRALLLEQAAEWGQPRTGGPAAAIWDSIIGVDMMVNIALGADVEEAVANAVSEIDSQLANFGS